MWKQGTAEAGLRKKDTNCWSILAGEAASLEKRENARTKWVRKHIVSIFGVNQNLQFLPTHTASLENMNR